MFEQHPVPQNISSYRFRLVGDMTLPQFFQLAGGALISLLIYASPLPGIFKWPLIVFFSLAGAALAFLPLEERPLDKWVIAFFRSVYTPTMFRWKKYDTPTSYFQEESVATAQTTAGQNQTTRQHNQTNTFAPAFLKSLDESERSLLGKFTSLFSLGGKPAQVPPDTPQMPNPTQTSIQQEEIITPPAPEAENKQQQTEAKPTRGEVMPVETTSVAETLAPGQTDTQALQAQFSPDAAPPLPPTQPNVVVGQVMNSDGSIVESAILEITDPMGRPVRALRTNKVGHFLIVTPLANGKYKIIIEKEGLNFDPLEIEAVGEIIPPIAIRATSQGETT